MWQYTVLEAPLFKPIVMSSGNADDVNDFVAMYLPPAGRGETCTEIFEGQIETWTDGLDYENPDLIATYRAEQPSPSTASTSQPLSIWNHKQSIISDISDKSGHRLFP